MTYRENAGGEPTIPPPGILWRAANFVRANADSFGAVILCIAAVFAVAWGVHFIATKPDPLCQPAVAVINQSDPTFRCPDKRMTMTSTVVSSWGKAELVVQCVCPSGEDAGSP